MNEPYAIVWRFEDAPDDLKKLSDNGGDEDWLAEFRCKSRGAVPRWIESMGRCNLDILDHPTRPGWSVAIGSHS